MIIQSNDRMVNGALKKQTRNAPCSILPRSRSHIFTRHTTPRHRTPTSGSCATHECKFGTRTDTCTEQHAVRTILTDRHLFYLPLTLQITLKMLRNEVQTATIDRDVRRRAWGEGEQGGSRGNVRMEYDAIYYAESQMQRRTARKAVMLFISILFRVIATRARREKGRPSMQRFIFQMHRCTWAHAGNANVNKCRVSIFHQPHALSVAASAGNVLHVATAQFISSPPNMYFIFSCSTVIVCRNCKLSYL